MRTTSDPSTTATSPGGSRVGARLVALDGVRGVAIIAVLLYHGLPSVAPGGFLGVSVFFTLSGFLVGRLLTGTGSWEPGGLRSFWARRARRLAPAGVAGLGLAVVVALVADVGRTSLWGGVWSSLVGMTNWWLIADAHRYGAGFDVAPLVQPYWSLAIEVQLYLVVPLALWACRRFGGDRWRRLAVGIAALVVVGVTALELVVDLDVDRAYYGTDTRAPELLVGLVLALVLADRPLDDLVAPARRRLAGGLGAVAFALVVVAVAVAHLGDAWVVRGGLTAVAVVSAVLVVGAATPGAMVATVLSARPLVAVGAVSYGLYVYHWPVFAWLDPARTGWSAEALLLPRLVIVGLLAVISARLLELPVRRGGRLAGRSWPVPALAVAVVVAGVAVPVAEPDDRFDLATVPVATDEAGAVTAVGPYQPPPTTLPASATTTPTTVPLSADVGWAPTATGLAPTASQQPSRALRTLVVGDSTAFPVGKLLDAWGTRTGLLSAVPIGAMGCGLLPGGERLHAGQAESNAGDCLAHDELWAPAIETFAPDVVVVVSGLWDATDHRLEGDDAWRAPGDPVYDAALAQAYADAADALGTAGVPVLWLEAPPILWDPDPARLSPDDIGANDPARMDRLNELVREVAATRPWLAVVPYAQFLRSWPGGVFDTGIRPDGVHVDQDRATALADWLGPEVLATYWDVRGP